jgi:hypothetical protein
MVHGCSSKLMAATPPAFAPLHRLTERTRCLKRKHILLAFVRQSDVKTSETFASAKARVSPNSGFRPTGLDPKNCCAWRS